MLTAVDLELAHLAGLPPDEFHRDEGAAFRLLAALRTRDWEVTIASDLATRTWHVKAVHYWRGWFERAEARSFPLAAVAVAGRALAR